VIGFVHPGHIWRKSGARDGDVLMLSKPLGTGLLLSSQSPEYLPAAVQVMRETNRVAAAALRSQDSRPHAVTDVTGYGLLGHAGEMALQSGVDLVLEARLLPLLPGALAAAAAGVKTSVHRRDGSNLPNVDPAILAILQDPQTSGGLLAAVSDDRVAELESAGFVRIGVARAGSGRVLVQ
jgi:selenide,water dikinase